MSLRGMEALLQPKSIAVVGASDTPGRAGNLIMRNLLDGGFSGPVLPVTPDLAVACTHGRRNLDLLTALGEWGCKKAIVLSAPATQFDDLRACLSVSVCGCCAGAQQFGAAGTVAGSERQLFAGPHPSR